MQDLLEALGAGLQSEDERDGRIYGLQYGTIKDVKDPQGLGRIKARTGAMADSEVSNWLDPAWPGSLECIPRKEDPCFVAYVDGDPHRGVYWWHPTTKTKDRPSEAAVLGTVMAAMYNDLVTQFNQLRTDFNTFRGSAYAVHTHLGGGLTSGDMGVTITGSTGGPSAAGSNTSATAAGKAKDAGGSVVTAKAGDQVALSGAVKVGK